MSGRQENRCVVRLNMPPNERPHMKELHRYLTDYCEFWRPTGLNLGLESSILGLIEANNLHQQRKCFRKTLERWLQQDVQATWCKLELAITNAKREFHGYHALDAMPNQYSVASSLDNTVEPKVQDTPSHKKYKRTEDHGATASMKNSQPTDDNESDEDSTIDGTIKKANSRYHLITTRSPMCAIVINNHTFNKVTSLCERRGSGEDLRGLQALKDYGLEFHWFPENCTAEEMDTALKVISSSDDIQKKLLLATKSSEMNEALEKFKESDEIKTTMKVLTNEECKTALETITKYQGMRSAVLKILEKPLSTYHGLVVFIMTHGGESGKLFGSDGKHITVEKIASLFNASNCPELANKPKIFIIQASWGNRDNQGAIKDSSHPHIDDIESKNPSMGAVSFEEDFLFVYSTTAHYVAGLHEEGSPFIQSLVEVLDGKLNDEHLEDALLQVKDKVASKSVAFDGKVYKQIPTVISQMRDKVWFHK